MIRRLQTRRLEQINGGGPNATGPGSHLVNDHAFRFGYFGIGGRGSGGGGAGGGRDSLSGPLGFGFVEPPPPYTFWKPPEHFIVPGEAPPSYEETINPNTPSSQQTLPMVFPVDMGTSAQQQQPGINPQVQHLNVQYHGNVYSGTGMPSYAYTTGTVSGSITGLPEGAPPGRVISLTNNSLSTLYPRPMLSGACPLPAVPNVHLNRLGPGLEPGLDARDPGPLTDNHHHQMSTQENTYSKGHYLGPSAHLVRHNSMPMSRNAVAYGGHMPADSRATGTTLRQHPSFQHTMGTYQQHHFNANNAYQQRLVTHLASPLNGKLFTKNEFYKN